MKIAFVGMGKLGFPCALAAASRGHDVVGFDADLKPYDIIASKKYPHREVHAQEMLKTTTLRMVVTMKAVVEHADIVFIAVQTPHRPEFEGLNRMPDERADFDYEALKAAVADVADEAKHRQKEITIVVISTCLPGTYQREIYPLLKDNDFVGFVYNPFFIAMGTTIDDYLKPEFVLLGHDPAMAKFNALERVQKFYCDVHNWNAGGNLPLPPHAVMSVPSAEATKIAYNTFLGQKIINANGWMEICHKTGANIDEVTNALGLATDRVVSAKYMRGGMGDGGGCHPRDAIALSWLAQELGLSYDIGGEQIIAREKQTEWLADLALEHSDDGKLPIVILGKAYKKGTNLTLGSPAILLKNILDEYSHLQLYQWDPHVDGYPVGAYTNRFVVCGLPEVVDGDAVFTPKAAVYVVATDHDEFFKMTFPEGSVVIDPWGRMPAQVGATVVRVGRETLAPLPAEVETEKRSA